jgi:hypothetical protein
MKARFYRLLIMCGAIAVLTFGIYEGAWALGKRPPVDPPPNPGHHHPYETPEPGTLSLLVWSIAGGGGAYILTKIRGRRK